MNTKIFLMLAAALLSVSTFGQGTILFNNRPSTGDARVTRDNGTGAGAGVSAQLFLVGAGGALTPLTPITTFRTSSPAAMFFVNPITVTVPGIPAGSPATVRMRAWEGPSYQAAMDVFGVYGESNTITISQLGGIPPDGGAPIPDPALAGLQSFCIGCIPEPSTTTLGALGAAALLFRRRR